MTWTPYHAKYFAYELTRRHPADSLQKMTATLADAQVELNPHQVEAALFAFQSPLSKGAILADEVGLGKTIEAGLVLSQKWAELRRRIIVIVPANLRKQWSQELQDKFFLPSIILEKASFDAEQKKQNYNPFEQKDKIVICSFQFARSKEYFLRGVKWDLAVIDEAHRLRNVYRPDNKIGNAIKNALFEYPKLLLTATPLQNSLLELYGLVSIIDDHVFGDLKSFKSQFLRLAEEENFTALRDRLQPVCKRTLRRQVLEYIKYTNRIPITQDFHPTAEEHRLYNFISDYLREERLFALPAGQRQLMTLIMRKLLASSTYAIAGTLKKLADRLTDIADNAQMAETDDVVTLVEDNYDDIRDFIEEYGEAVGRLHAASEPDNLNDLEDDEAESDDDAPDTPPQTFTAADLAAIRAETAHLREYQALAESILKNSKGEVLKVALQKGFAKLAELGAARKAIIFTESTRTQQYLKSLLEANGYGGQIVLFNGSNTDLESKRIYREWLEKNADTDRITGSRTADTRAALVEYFRDQATVMIATEAAAEGINLQFCSLVVNYDLPWNPQRIEQRIGRCHRYGQKFDVVVVNFLNRDNEADVRVFEILREKFLLFDGVFGASDEVLGSIESGVDFEKRIAGIYQTCRTRDEIDEAFDLLQKELEPDITARLDDTRRKLLENFDEEVIEKLKINLRKSKEYLNRYETMLWDLTQWFLHDAARFDEQHMAFSLLRNPFPGEKIHPGPYRMAKNAEDANRYRAGHPLAIRLLEQCKSLETPNVCLLFDYDGTPSKITPLEIFRGHSGFLELCLLTIESAENEDHLIFSAGCDDGSPLDSELCRRLFSLPATIDGMVSSHLINRDKLETARQTQITQLLKANEQRNAEWFRAEVDKLHRWADDRQTAAEAILKETKTRIKDLNRQASKAADPREIIQLQEEIQELTKKQNRLRREIFDIEDETNAQRDRFIADIKLRLTQKTDIQTLFTIRWQLA